MFQVAALTLWLLNSVAAWPDGATWPWDATPCSCDGLSFISKTGGENPCGCNFVKKTARRELTAMTNDQLERMSSGLQDEVDALQTTFKGDETKNREKLGNLKKELAEVKEQKKKQADDEESALEGRKNEMNEFKKETEVKQAKIADIDEDLKMNQLLLKDVRTSIALRMQDVYACDCKKVEETGANAALVTKHVGRPEFRKNDVDYTLVYKIEKLERSKAKLSKAITKEQSTFGWKSRYLMKTIDKQKIRIDVSENSNVKHEVLDKQRLESVTEQQQNVERTLERKTAQLKQMEKDVAESQTKYDKLEAEMKQCGCERPSETELDMRKFQLRNL